MVEYDPGIIKKFAGNLYTQANIILLTYTIAVGVLGAGIIYGIEIYTHMKIGVWLGMILGALIGYAIAVEKAFKLKLQAQTALCQLKIEENTRK